MKRQKTDDRRQKKQKENRLKTQKIGAKARFSMFDNYL